jgi:hypothetical protein
VDKRLILLNVVYAEDRDIPGRVDVSAVTNNSATTHWDAVVVRSPPLNPNVAKSSTLL